MSTLKILDTGFVSTETRSTQTQLSDANRAGYTGSAVSSFTLETSSVGLSGDVNIEQKPIINSMEDNSSSLISVNNRAYTVSFILAKDIVTSGWSTNNLYQFCRMDRTYGLKLLYPSATGDSIPTIVEALGAINTNNTDLFSDSSASDDNGTVGTTIPYLIGRVKNIRIMDNPRDNSYWKISFDFVVSG